MSFTFPVYYNDGRSIESEKFDRLQQTLLEEFGGVTYLTVPGTPNRGLWKMGGVTYRDEILIYCVVTSDAAAARRFFARLKRQLKRELDQEEIFIVERDVKTLYLPRHALPADPVRSETALASKENKAAIK